MKKVKKQKKHQKIFLYTVIIGNKITRSVYTEKFFTDKKIYLSSLLKKYYGDKLEFMGQYNVVESVAVREINELKDLLNNEMEYDIPKIEKMASLILKKENKKL